MTGGLRGEKWLPLSSESGTTTYCNEKQPRSADTSTPGKEGWGGDIIVWNGKVGGVGNKNRQRESVEGDNYLFIYMYIYFIDPLRETPAALHW